MHGTASEKGCGREREGTVHSQDIQLLISSLPPTHLVTLDLLPTFFSTLVFSWVSSYTRVGENRDNIREGTFQILLVEWSANVSNSCLYLRGQKSAVWSKEWQLHLGISFGVGPVGDFFFTCSLSIGPSILPSVFHLMGRVTSGGLTSILWEGMRTPVFKFLCTVSGLALCLHLIAWSFCLIWFPFLLFIELKMIYLQELMGTWGMAKNTYYFWVFEDDCGP